MKITKLLQNSLLVFSLFIARFSYAQLPDGFDIKAANAEAIAKGIPASDIKGYVEYLHNDYLSHRNGHRHANGAPGEVYDAGTIYMGFNSSTVFRPGSPNPSPQNAYCPNAGFEQGNFANWTGGYGTVSNGGTGAPFPIYNQTSATIQNSAGNNVNLYNTINYHTIMTTPATSSVYPNYVGYDSIAARVIGTQTVSEIPVVNPNGGPASVRLNGAVANYRASKLNYIMALNPNNKNFSISYALVLNNGGHTAAEQPYFSVKVTDQNGALVPGCSVYTVTCSDQLTNPSSPMYDPTWANSINGWNDIMYRKWQTFAFDFSNYPSVTSVNVEFYVGGCAQGGHWGYAYVDAACSQGGAVASFCAGSTTSVLNAPPGYLTYQWLGPSGPISAANGGNTSTATITPVTAGQVFTCNVTAPNGCSSAFQTTVAVTTISITGVGSTPSCQNGTSGTANVSATGSSSGYSYQWLNSSGGTVGTAQTATGLSPGTYSVIVSSPMCGSATETVAVGISAPTFYSLSAPYCGTTAWITTAGGSNYKWYTASPLAIIPGATSSSLTINSPVNGASYFLVYTTPSGCKDSVRYTLSQQPGGSIYVSNIKSICAGNSNSYGVVNLQTTATPAIYSYTVTGPGGYSSVLNNTSAVKDSVTGLSIGTYTADVFDGQCLYNTTFTVSPFVYSYTLTPLTFTACAGGSTSLTVNFGNTTPTACGLSSSGSCTSPNLIQLGTGTMVNSNTSYPAIYSNWYKNARHQILYRASELTAAGIVPGKISSIAFNITTINGTTSYPNFTIKMKCTTVNNLNSTTFDNTGLTQVYFSPNINITTGWNTYTFPTAYEWDGVSNILIDVCSSLTANYTYNSESMYTNTTFTSVRYFNSDATPACMTTNTGYTSSSRPNIKFQNCGGANPSAFNYTWTPTTGLNPTNTYTTIANPTVTTVYTVQVNPIGQTNCMQAQSATITIVNPVTPTITPVSPLCTNASSLNLAASPAGGTWAGSGVTAAGVLTPSAAAIGNNTYTYTVGSGSCSATGSTTVSVEQYVPSTITGTVPAQCITDPAVDLLPLTTSTLGVWSGNGVSGTTFDPAVAGAGTHTLTYSTNSLPTASLCPSSSTLEVTVISIAQPTITAVNPLCNNAAPLMMNVVPTGGVWTGPGIDPTGVFTPAMIPVAGTYTYTYTVGTGTCSNTNTTTIMVEEYVPSTITGSISPLCVTNLPVNLVPLTTYTTGAWAGNGVTGTAFDPALATAGTHTITYTTDSPSLLCPETSSLVVSVSFVAQPNITAAGPFCTSFADQTLLVDQPGGVWSSTNTATSINATSGVFSPATSTVGDNTIIYTLTNGPCVKSDTIVVNVVQFVPATLLGILGPYCIYDPSVNLQTIAANPGGVWSGPGVGGTMFTPSVAGAGTQTVTYSTDPAPAGLCPDQATAVIIVNAKPEADALGDKVNGCNPVTVNYFTTSTNTGFGSWNFGDGSTSQNGLSASHTYTVPGTYTAVFTYTDNAGCLDTTIAASAVTIYSVPVAAFDASPDITTVVDGQVEFTNNTSNLANNTYAWDFGGLAYSYDVNPSYLFTISGEFFVTLVATSPEGCQDTEVKKVTINPDIVLYVPNAFTPGGDGLNDEFQIFLPPTGVDFSTFSLTIYDRWGEVVYKTNDVTQSWNGAKNNSGNIMKQDTYVYKISFMDEKKKYYEKLGYVTMLRK
jgi:gliding motility-associated-like protein